MCQTVCATACFVLGPCLPARRLGLGLGQAEAAGRHSSGRGLAGRVRAVGAGSPATTPPRAPPLWGSWTLSFRCNEP